MSGGATPRGEVTKSWRSMEQSRGGSVRTRAAPKVELGAEKPKPKAALGGFAVLAGFDDGESRPALTRVVFAPVAADASTLPWVVGLSHCCAPGID